MKLLFLLSQLEDEVDEEENRSESPLSELELSSMPNPFSNRDDLHAALRRRTESEIDRDSETHGDAETEPPQDSETRQNEDREFEPEQERATGQTEEGI
jgi:hypothetical protein